MKTRDVITSGISTIRLAEICEAERDGRCVVLPNRGDKLYYAPYPKGAKGCRGDPMFLRNNEDGSGIVEAVRVQVRFHNWTGLVPIKKTYATRAEAEAALKEAEHA